MSLRRTPRRTDITRAVRTLRARAAAVAPLACLLAPVAAAVGVTELPAPTAPGAYMGSNIAADGTVVGSLMLEGKVLRWTPGAPAPENLGGDLFTLENVLPLMSKDGGTIAANHYRYEGENIYSDSARWVGGTEWEALPGMTYDESTPFAISYDGAAIGGEGRDYPPTPPEEPIPAKAWVWHVDSGMVELPLPDGGWDGHVWGVSNDGTVAVGYSQQSFENSTRYAVRWANGGAEWITDDLTGTPLGQAVACNSDCSIVVGAGRDSSAVETMNQAWLWTEASGPTWLGELDDATPDLLYYPLDVSDDGGVVVGCYTDYNDEIGTFTRAFVWTQDAGIRRVETILAEAGVEYDVDWSEQCANSVSPDGTKVLLNGYDSEYVRHVAVVDLAPTPVEIFADGFEPDDAAPWPTPQ